MKNDIASDVMIGKSCQIRPAHIFKANWRSSDVTLIIPTNTQWNYLLVGRQIQKTQDLNAVIPIASVYRVLTNQRKRFFLGLISGNYARFPVLWSQVTYFCFAFRFVDCVIFVCRDWLSTFALVIRQSLQTRQTTRTCCAIKTETKFKWVLHSPEVLNRKTYHASWSTKHTHWKK